MARWPRLFVPEVLYNVIVRENRRQKSFTSDFDDQAYLERLASYQKKYRDIATVASLVARISERLRSDVKRPREIERRTRAVELW